VVRNGKPELATIDEAYLKESIVKPAASIVDGYQPIMPVEDDLSPDEVSALVQFIKELK